ncbi:MAG TPA: FAD-dependent oxidoreductase, partial [Candidatus Brocadiia bacterium]|nr:FAD-dependent oxidoreductase [Candidatus Brocadiia bacterium]
MQFDKSFDILVAGAGVAGVAAALEAARAGYRVALVEKTVMLGGLATTGLIHVYLPLCDGCGHQVTAGIAEELFHLSYKYGPGGVPPTWRNPEPKPGGQRYRTLFSPASFNLAMDEALEQAGVEIWLDTLICQTMMEGDRAAGVEVENKSGRGLLRARMIVDATGDADVAYRAGAPCRESGNWLSIWVLEISLEAARQAVAAGSGENLFKHFVHSEGGSRELAPPGGGYRGTNGRDVTRIVLDGRKRILEKYKTRYAAGERPKDAYPIALPAMPTFRTTR